MRGILAGLNHHLKAWRSSSVADAMATGYVTFLAQLVVKEKPSPICFIAQSVFATVDGKERIVRLPETTVQTTLAWKGRTA